MGRQMAYGDESVPLMDLRGKKAPENQAIRPILQKFISSSDIESQGPSSIVTLSKSELDALAFFIMYTSNFVNELLEAQEDPFDDLQNQLLTDLRSFLPPEAMLNKSLLRLSFEILLQEAQTENSSLLDLEHPLLIAIKKVANRRLEAERREQDPNKKNMVLNPHFLSEKPAIAQTFNTLTSAHLPNLGYHLFSAAIAVNVVVRSMPNITDLPEMPSIAWALFFVCGGGAILSRFLDLIGLRGRDNLFAVLLMVDGAALGDAYISALGGKDLELWKKSTIQTLVVLVYGLINGYGVSKRYGKVNRQQKNKRKEYLKGGYADSDPKYYLGPTAPSMIDMGMWTPLLWGGLDSGLTHFIEDYANLSDATFAHNLLVKGSLLTLLVLFSQVGMYYYQTRYRLPKVDKALAEKGPYHAAKKGMYPVRSETANRIWIIYGSLALILGIYKHFIPWLTDQLEDDPNKHLYLSIAKAISAIVIPFLGIQIGNLRQRWDFWLNSPARISKKDARSVSSHFRSMELSGDASALLEDYQTKGDSTSKAFVADTLLNFQDNNFEAGHRDLINSITNVAACVMIDEYGFSVIKSTLLQMGLDEASAHFQFLTMIASFSLMMLVTFGLVAAVHRFVNTNKTAFNLWTSVLGESRCCGTKRDTAFEKAVDKETVKQVLKEKDIKKSGDGKSVFFPKANAPTIQRSFYGSTSEGPRHSLPSLRA